MLPNRHLTRLKMKPILRLSFLYVLFRLTNASEQDYTITVCTYTSRDASCSVCTNQPSMVSVRSSSARKIQIHPQQEQRTELCSPLFCIGVCCCASHGLLELALLLSGTGGGCLFRRGHLLLIFVTCPYVGGMGTGGTRLPRSGPFRPRAAPVTRHGRRVDTDVPWCHPRTARARGRTVVCLGRLPGTVPARLPGCAPAP